MSILHKPSEDFLGLGWVGECLKTYQVMFCYILVVSSHAHAHPCVTAVAHKKRSRSFCQNNVRDRLQLNTHTPCICGFAWSDMLHGVHRTCQDGSSFMWHQPCQRCKYTTSMDIQKHAINNPVIHVESRVSTVSLLESREQCYKKVINNFRGF